MAAAVAQSWANAQTGNLSSLAASSGASVTSGNFIVLFVRNGGGVGVLPSSIGSSLGLTYTQQSGASDTTQDPQMVAYTAPVTSSGTETVTVNWSVSGVGGGFYAWFRAIEVSGQATVSPVDTTDKKAAGSAPGNVASSNAFSTTTAGIVLSAISQNAGATYTAGTDFTLISGQEGHATGLDFGGTEYYVTSAALSSYTAHFTASGTNQYTMVTVALKAAGGGASTWGPLLGLQNNRLVVAS